MPEWDKIVEWTWLGLAQLWSFFAVAFFVYTLGVVSKQVAKKKGWKGTDENPSWFDIWQRIAPFFGGALLGLIPFPSLHAIDNINEGSWNIVEVAARVGWFSLAGGCCGQVYEFATFVWGIIKRRLGALAAAKESAS